MENKIAWNIWQMDGLTFTVPYGKQTQKYRPITLFDFDDSESENCEENSRHADIYPTKTAKSPEAVPCRIFNWRSNSSLRFTDIKEM